MSIVQHEEAAFTGCRRTASNGAGAISDFKLPPATPNLPVPIWQVFSYGVPDPSVLVGNVSFVWGPLPASGLPAPVPGVPSYVYWPAYRSAAGLTNLSCVGCIVGGTNPTWDWFLAHEPTLVEYKADQLTPSWENSDFVDVPLAWTNPDVFTFITTGSGFWQGLAGVLTSYAGLAVDNATYENNWGSSGHFTGTPTLALCTETSHIVVGLLHGWKISRHLIPVTSYGGRPAAPLPQNCGNGLIRRVGRLFAISRNPVLAQCPIRAP